jgi:hypothetical protein
MSAAKRRQQVIPGTETPEHADVAEAFEELRGLQEQARRIAKDMEAARARLVVLMMRYELARYDLVDTDGGKWCVALDLPEQPGVRLRFIGKAGEGD